MTLWPGFLSSLGACLFLGSNNIENMWILYRSRQLTVKNMKAE